MVIKLGNRAATPLLMMVYYKIRHQASKVDLEFLKQVMVLWS